MVKKLECFSQFLLNNCVEETRTFPRFTLSYLTLLGQLLESECFCWKAAWILMTKPKRGEHGSTSLSERQKLQRLYTHGGAADVSLRNLLKASDQPVIKSWKFFTSRQFVHKSHFSTRKAKGTKDLLGSRKSFRLWIMVLLINWQKLLLQCLC